MPLVDLIAIVAVLEYLTFAALTGKARRSSELEAPAVTGHPDFERMYRVQMNTLELLIAFLPALYIAAQYWPSLLVFVLGVVYVVGRFIYWRAYVSEPAKRGPGFILSLFPIGLLAVLALLGALMALAGF